MPPGSTQLLLLLTAGASLYLGLFHLGLRRQHPAHAWISWWALASTGFVVARFVQLDTRDPELAVAAARISTGLAPIIIWTLMSFVGEFARERPSRNERLAFTAGSIALSAGIVFTSFGIADTATERLSLSGETYYGSVARPGMLLLLAYVCAALGWGWRRVMRSSALQIGERRTLAIALMTYAAMGATSMFASLGWTAWPGVAEFAPLVVAVAASRLVATRERRLQENLSSLVDQQTAALRASEARYRILVENAPIGVLACDRDSRVLTLTRRFREIVGLDPAAAQAGSDLLEAADMVGGPRGAPLRAALRTGRQRSGETTFTRPDGRVIDLKAIIAPQHNDAGEVSGALVLIEDVTERRSFEARVRQAHKMEAIGQLAVGIARGITAPMESLRMNLAVMRNECEAVHKSILPDALSAESSARFAEIEELIDESCEGVERTIAIVHDMSQLSRGGSLAIETIDLNAMLQAVVRMAASQRRGAATISERYGELPAIRGNSGQLRQVFLNLVVNALHAVGETGRVEVETACDGDRVCVRVADDGPGISAEHRERLFVPFFTTKPAGEGTGLGLFLSHQIVHTHGGEIRVSSEPGAGASFEVRLPLEAAPFARRAP